MKKSTTIITVITTPFLLVGIALVLALLLSGCASSTPPVERLVVQTPTVPDGYLACRSAPVPPKATKQSQVGRYVADLAEAGEDCRTKLGTVRGLLSQEPTP